MQVLIDYVVFVYAGNLEKVEGQQAIVY